MRSSIRFTAATATAAAALLATLTVSSSTTARAATEEFHLVDQSCAVDKTAGTATFRLSFAKAPQFFPAQGGGEQPDTFQIDIDADHNTFDHPIEFDEIDSVVRGAEIAAGDGIPVRAREGDGGSDQSGGWGPVRALVPFELSGSTLTFTTGLNTIGDQDGKFRYRVITMDGGSLTSEVNAAIIPVPVALSGGMMLLGGAGIVHKLRKRKFC
jgi:hypothetical protein